MTNDDSAPLVVTVHDILYHVPAGKSRADFPTSAASPFPSCGCPALQKGTLETCTSIIISFLTFVSCVFFLFYCFPCFIWRVAWKHFTVFHLVHQHFNVRNRSFIRNCNIQSSTRCRVTKCLIPCTLLCNRFNRPFSRIVNLIF